MPLLKYTLARFGLLVVLLTGLWFIGARSWLWIAAGLALSSVLAYLTMRSLRDAATQDLEARRQRRENKEVHSIHDAEEAIEDGQVDATH